MPVCVDSNQDMTCISYVWPKINVSYRLLSLRFGESFLPLCKHVCIHVRTTCIELCQLDHLKYIQWNKYHPKVIINREKMFCSCLERRFPMQQSQHKSNQTKSSICLASLCNTSQKPENTVINSKLQLTEKPSHQNFHHIIS